MSYQRIDWTPDMDAAINVEGRANLAQLARELQVSANAIRLRALKLNAPERPEAWQNWQLDILKAEWPKGTLSSSQIGNLIGKTRNAVIGKAHRLKLGNRTPSGDRRSGSDRKERPPRVKATIPRAPKTNMAIIKKGVIPPRFYPEAVPLTTKPPISIMELVTNTCHAPVGYGPDGLVVYCGDFTFADKPYCEGHCAMYYAPPRVRRFR